MTPLAIAAGTGLGALVVAYGVARGYQTADQLGAEYGWRVVIVKGPFVTAGKLLRDPGLGNPQGTIFVPPGPRPIAGKGAPGSLQSFELVEAEEIYALPNPNYTAYVASDEYAAGWQSGYQSARGPVGRGPSTGDFVTFFLQIFAKIAGAAISAI